ncbi:MAG: M28 family peptidase [Chloroflexota bacterium]
MIDYVRALENRSNYARGEQILAALAAMGLEPTIQVCRWPRIRNIIVDFVPESSSRRFLFSAHYDAVRNSPGSNDNASGVAVLLGLCNELRHKQQPARIVFFDREEAWLRTPTLRLGLLGSLYYVRKADLQNVAAVYNLEFCGQGDFLAIWPVKGHEIRLAAVRQIEEIATRQGLPHKTTHIPWLLLSSDHLSFRIRGFPNVVTLSLLPSSQISVLEGLLQNLSFIRLLTGWRPTLPEPLRYIHSCNDTSSKLDEGSLKLMLSLLLDLIKTMDVI